MIRKISLLLMLCLAIAMQAQSHRTLDNPFAVFNNGIYKANTDSIPFGEMADQLRQWGYDGVEWRELNRLEEAIEVFGKRGIRVLSSYVNINIDSPQPYLPTWKAMIPKLKGTGFILEVHIHSSKFKPSDEAADALIVPILQELADLAKPAGVKIAIYPHIDFLAETVQDAYRLAMKADRDNVGAMFNLCHFLRRNEPSDLAKVLDRVLPKLMNFSINGSDGGETMKMNWDRLIRPLGEGSLDVYRIVEYVVERGYRGPIELQCFNIAGAPQDYLIASGQAWREFKRRYESPLNSLSSAEKAQGWELLFDGRTTDQWRGINKDHFPKSGWRVADEALIADVEGGCESTEAGDIITRKKYGAFTMKWEWSMKSCGGNSGVKYYVMEGVGKNDRYGYGIEYQLMDDANFSWMAEGKMKPNDYRTLGAAYELYPASSQKSPSPLGLWNESMIVCNGTIVEHWLNGKLILRYDRSNDNFKQKIRESKFKDIPGYGVIPEGHLLLQDHGSVIHFRNIKVLSK